jgi:hypothetical protein
MRDRATVTIGRPVLKSQMTNPIVAMIVMNAGKAIGLKKIALIFRDAVMRA